jgi:hypothetical protein
MGRKGGGKVKIIQKGGPGGGMGGGPNMMQGMMQNMPPPPRAVNPEIWVIPKGRNALQPVPRFCSVMEGEEGVGRGGFV